jgi:hypothetical protein
MTARLLRRLALVSTLTFGLVLGTLPASQAASGGIQVKPIGDPIWKPVDCHVFSAPVGTAATGFAEFFETIAALLPPPNHAPHPDLGIGPGTPHQPPYTSELDAGVAAQAFKEGHRFRQAEFSNGSGVFLACMIVPKPGTTGSSPDFVSGPIISNDLFPVQVLGFAERNGAPFDPALANFMVPALDAELNPPFDVDGHSHFPIFVATNQEVAGAADNVRGRYQYDITLTDDDGNGWQVRAHFVIRR